MRLLEILGRMNEAADNLSDDPEALHADLDKILLDAVHPLVRDKYNEIADKAKWWAAS